MSLDPFRAAVPFWGQSTWEFEWFVPQNGTAVLKGLTLLLGCKKKKKNESILLDAQKNDVVTHPSLLPSSTTMPDTVGRAFPVCGSILCTSRLRVDEGNKAREVFSR